MKASIVLGSLLALLALASCDPGSICGENGCGDGDVNPCDRVVCLPGQLCEAGYCRMPDLCADVLCSNPAEVCDARNGECRPGSIDNDHDGHTLERGDCDDTDPEIYGGAAERCNGIDDDCDRDIDEGIDSRPCSATCGDGEERCEAGGWQCSAPEVGECTIGENSSQECGGGCGEQSRTCSDTCEWGSWSDCHIPAETCNAVDDDCNDECDEGLEGCRHPIHRSTHELWSDHFYTEDREEAECCGYALEVENYMYLYTQEVPGRTTAFYRCWHDGDGADHLYTTERDCEELAGYVLEEGRAIGFIATEALCDALPLYRFWNADETDHLYTRDPAERDLIRTLPGWEDQGIVGYVWTGP